MKKEKIFCLTITILVIVSIFASSSVSTKSNIKKDLTISKDNSKFGSLLENNKERYISKFLDGIINTHFFKFIEKNFKLKNQKDLLKHGEEKTSTEIIYKEYYPGAPFNEPNVIYYSAEDQIIVQFETCVDVETVGYVLDYRVQDRNIISHSVTIEVKNQNLKEVIYEIEQNVENVIFAEINKVGQGCSITYKETVSINEKSRDWGLKAIRCPEAWNLRRCTGKNVKVAILDSGLDYNHPDLQFGKCIGGYNYVGYEIDESHNFFDHQWHGTFTTGLIHAAHNDLGINGVAPDCKIIPISVININNSVKEFDLVEGLTHADQNIDTDIICMALSLPPGDEYLLLENKCKELYHSGKLLIAAVGNAGGNVKLEIWYPAAYPEVIGVGAVEWSKDLNNNKLPDLEELKTWKYTRTGQELDIVAPGVDIYSTKTGGEYVYSSGTSASTAYVAGVAALYYEKYPDATPDECRDRLFETARDLSKNKPHSKTKDIIINTYKNEKYGHGLVDAYRVCR